MKEIEELTNGVKVFYGIDGEFKRIQMGLLAYIADRPERHVRSFVKQKDNDVWILTVTFPDPDGCATSKFHTYCLAVGKSSRNHQPVIDHYLKEIEELTWREGVLWYC